MILALAAIATIAVTWATHRVVNWQRDRACIERRLLAGLTAAP